MVGLMEAAKAIFHIVGKTCESKTNFMMFSPQLRAEKKKRSFIRCHFLGKKTARFNGNGCIREYFRAKCVKML